MNDSGIRGFALKMIEQRLTPQQKSSPEIQEMIRAIRENDSEAGSRIALNLCSQRGVSKESAVDQAINMCQNMMNTLGGSK